MITVFDNILAPFKNIFNRSYDIESIANLLKTDKTLLKHFEKSYSKYAFNENETDNFFSVNSRQAAAANESLNDSNIDYNAISQRIIDELIAQTRVWSFDGSQNCTKTQKCLPDNHISVTAAEIETLPVKQRPMLTGNLMNVDINVPSSIALLENLNIFKKTGEKMFYHMFRQGLDILDYDPLMYAMIDTNPNSMSHWLPAIAHNAVSHGFFKIPKTTIIRVPMTMLQLTRKDYDSLTPATLDIVDKFCMKAFNLDVNKEYFIKTGTYSSKFDFRNAHVHGEKEVRELGEYLLFIHHQANMMASPLSNPCTYGVSTTTEWVVREFIEDKEDSPCIYKGLPLHTEYRVFVDFDTNNVIGISPYWEPETMNKRFAENRDIHDLHDATTYKMHEETLMTRYTENKNRIVDEIRKILPDTNLHGQWSIDIMQNNDEFWIIDMALAENSAFYDCVPVELRNPSIENWLPDAETISLAMKNE